MPKVKSPDSQKRGLEIQHDIDIPETLPPIISASRSTDIPAFYSDWFISRFNAGFLVWINPINQKPQIVDLKQVKFIIFWTKNADPLIKYLDFFDQKKVKYYFQYTLNNYDLEGYEPNISPLHDRIKTFKKLSKKIGKEKIIWRFDPLLLSNKITVGTLINRISEIGDEIHHFTEKLVVSFIDIEPYKRVRKNLDRSSLTDIREFEKTEMLDFGERISKLNKRWGLTLATCGESVDLSEFGIIHNKCIDPDLIQRIAANDYSFIKYVKEHSNKDRGQRKNCMCVTSKDIGQYNTCPHLCRYCYANYTPNIVKNNYQSFLMKNKCPTIVDGEKWERFSLKIKSQQLSLNDY